MLDRSRRLVPGSEAVSNGDFASSDISAWQLVTGANSWSSGVMNATGATYLDVPTISGRTYRLSADLAPQGTYSAELSVWQGGGFAVQLLSDTHTTASRTRTGFFIATASTSRLYLRSLAGSGSVNIDNISVRELPGNHARQTTSTARPTLRARYNLLTYSEDFANAAWPVSNLTVSANAAIAPDGTTTADLVYPTSTGGQRRFERGLSQSAATNTWSVSAKFSGIRWIYVFQSDGSGVAAWFDIQNGVLGTVAAGYSAAITAQANGYFRCTLTTPVSNPLYLGYFGLSSANNSEAVTANGTDGVLLWGADLRVANESASLPVYQRIAAATDYDTSGFPPYLAFDGSDDSMATSAINFSATDKMSVFAGVRKLSDAARGTVVELTASAAANNGAFHMTAPNAASATFAFESKGTVLTDAVEADNVPAAPVTVALTGLGNISGDSTIIRVNGVQEDIDTGDQGTGNYANAAMFLGARNQASLFFNGRLYSLIVLGRAATAAEIVSTEEYVEQKTFGKALSLVYSDELQTADGDQITMDDGDPIYMTVAYQ